MSSSSLQPKDPPRIHRVLLVLAIVAAVVGFDLWTKAWAGANLHNTQPMVLIDGFFHFDLALNPGSAFGLFSNQPWARIFFIIFTFIALGYMGWLSYTLPTRAASGFVALAFIAGGAMGNLYDRLFRVFEGTRGVIDFIVVYYWPNKPWPTFNIADVALVIGVGLFFIYLYRHGEHEAPVATAKTSPASPA